MPARRRTGLVAAIALAVIGCQPPTPTVPASPLATIVLSVPLGSHDKTTIESAVTILEARVRALGVHLFTSTIGDEIVFTFFVEDPSIRTALDAVLQACGDVRFLPYEGGDPPAVGAPAPAGVAPLFDTGREVIAATTTAATGGPTTLDIGLGPDGARALATYTSAHVGDYLLIVMDGQVLAAPIVTSSIDDGQLQIDLAGDPDVSSAAIAAILTSGPMPEAWTRP